MNTSTYRHKRYTHIYVVIDVKSTYELLLSAYSRNVLVVDQSTKCNSFLLLEQIVFVLC